MPQIEKRECKRHGFTDFVLEGRGYYRCKTCRKVGVVEWRRRTKARLVKELGGKCSRCGYDRYLGALDFHHVDPKQKSFGLAMKGLARSYAKNLEEAKKCIVLCANCHREVEAGL